MPNANKYVISITDDIMGKSYYMGRMSGCVMYTTKADKARKFPSAAAAASKIEGIRREIKAGADEFEVIKYNPAEGAP